MFSYRLDKFTVKAKVIRSFNEVETVPIPRIPLIIYNFLIQFSDFNLI